MLDKQNLQDIKDLQDLQDLEDLRRPTRPKRTTRPMYKTSKIQYGKSLQTRNHGYTNTASFPESAAKNWPLAHCK